MEHTAFIAYDVLSLDVRDDQRLHRDGRGLYLNIGRSEVESRAADLGEFVPRDPGLRSDGDIELIARRMREIIGRRQSLRDFPRVQMMFESPVNAAVAAHRLLREDISRDDRLVLVATRQQVQWQADPTDLVPRDPARRSDSDNRRIEDHMRYLIGRNQRLDDFQRALRVVRPQVNAAAVAHRLLNEDIRDDHRDIRDDRRLRLVSSTELDDVYRRSENNRESVPRDPALRSDEQNRLIAERMRDFIGRDQRLSDFRYAYRMVRPQMNAAFAARELLNEDIRVNSRLHLIPEAERERVYTRAADSRESVPRDPTLRSGADNRLIERHLNSLIGPGQSLRDFSRAQRMVRPDDRDRRRSLEAATLCSSALTSARERSRTPEQDRTRGAEPVRERSPTPARQEARARGKSK
jgi:hypothetical protein